MSVTVELARVETTAYDLFHYLDGAVPENIELDKVRSLVHELNSRYLDYAFEASRPQVDMVD